MVTFGEVTEFPRGPGGPGRPAKPLDEDAKAYIDKLIAVRAEDLRDEHTVARNMWRGIPAVLDGLKEATTFVREVRRVAASLGLGLGVKISEPSKGKGQVQVVCRIRDKTKRPRKTEV